MKLFCVLFDMKVMSGTSFAVNTANWTQCPNPSPLSIYIDSSCLSAPSLVSLIVSEYFCRSPANICSFFFKSIKMLIEAGMFDIRSKYTVSWNTCFDPKGTPSPSLSLLSLSPSLFLPFSFSPLSLSPLLSFSPSLFLPLSLSAPSLSFKTYCQL